MSVRQYQFIQEDFKEIISNTSIDALGGLKNSSILLTGGAGFLGTWIAELINYLNEEYSFHVNVSIIDRNIENIQTQNPHLVNSKLFNFRQLDVRNIIEIDKQTNYIIHAAGNPDGRLLSSIPVEVISSISNGTENILLAAERLSNLKMFLHLSSSLVYGNFMNINRNIKEYEYRSDSDFSNSNLYSEAKRYSEAVVRAYRQQFRIPTLILRPFSFLGPFQSIEGPWVINNIFKDILTGKVIRILGDGETVRSFLYGAEAAFYILNALVNGSSGDILNLGSSHAISIKELVNLVCKVYGKDIDVLYCAGSGSNLNRTWMVPDLDLVNKKLKISQFYSLEKGIERTFKWFQLNG